jgi:hypothetical protein
MAQVVYTLECEQGKFYVGRCPPRRLPGRLHDHRTGQGSTWTAVYPAKLILKSKISYDPLDEDRVVLELMRVHGVHNVRGGTYSSLYLTDEQVQAITQQLDHAAGRCLSCKAFGHFASACPTPQLARSPFAMTQTPTQTWTQTPTQTPTQINQPSKTWHCCHRCGRTSHRAGSCFARSDIHGRPLI